MKDYKRINWIRLLVEAIRPKTGNPIDLHGNAKVRIYCRDRTRQILLMSLQYGCDLFFVTNADLCSASKTLLVHRFLSRVLQKFQHCARYDVILAGNPHNSPFYFLSAVHSVHGSTTTICTHFIKHGISTFHCKSGTFQR